jgi:hypothetical protein
VVSSDVSATSSRFWSSFQGGSADGVFGQHHSQMVPVELIRFGVE